MIGDAARDGKRMLERLLAMLTPVTRRIEEMKEEAVDCEYEDDQ